MHGPWHPILHNSPRSPKQQQVFPPGDKNAPVIANDYSWYRPLDSAKKEIRILFIEPEPLDSPKDIAIHVFSGSLLEPNIPRLYGCLSYCWGDSTELRQINVMYTEKSDATPNGLVTTRTRFNITSNLYGALRFLRSDMRRPVLWVDALCIDQSDPEERSEQVALMSEIYTQGMQTLIWIGEADSTTKSVFEFAKLLVIDLEANPNEVDPSTMAGGIVCGRIRPLAKGKLQFLPHELASDEFYKLRWGIQALLARPYFKRSWVLQEVGLADDHEAVIFCGQYSMWWRAFMNLTVFEWRAAAQQGPIPIDIERNYRLGLPLDNKAMVRGVNHTLPEVWTFIHLQTTPTKRGSILEFIFRRQGIHATDARDQVFALFGLAKECQNNENLPVGLRADYSLDVAEAYALFTKALIEKLQHTIVLSAVNIFDESPTREKRAIPSWVPEFDMIFDHRRCFAFIGQNRYQASGPPEVPLIRSDPKTLALASILIDDFSETREWGPYLMNMETINPMDEAAFAKLTVQGLPDKLRSLWKMVSTRVQKNPVVGQDLLESFILTLIACRRQHFNRDLIRDVKDLPGLFNDFIAYWKLHFHDFSDLPESSSLYDSQEQLAEIASKGQPNRFGQRMYFTCHQRAFLVTENLLLALVPRMARNGDQVAIFAGGNVPYVIRPVSQASLDPSSKSGGTKYELIGECYVHGRMHGSAMTDVSRGRFHIEVLKLV